MATEIDNAELERIAARFADLSEIELGRRFVKIEAEFSALRSRRPKTRQLAHARIDDLAAMATAALEGKLADVRFYAAGRELFLSDLVGLGDLVAATSPDVIERIHAAIEAEIPANQSDPFGGDPNWQEKRDSLAAEFRDISIERERRVYARSQAAAETSREAFEAKLAGK